MTTEELGPGSEGDAYRYTKKVLLSLPNAQELRQIYTEVAANRNISSWTRACYQELRSQFFRDGQCRIKFAPGVARIAFGELELGTGDEDFRKLADLRDYVRIISIAHFAEYSRHLAVAGRALTFADLTETYGSTAADNWKELKSELRKIHYGPRRYRIIWLDTFETAQQYYRYTEPHGWCHLSSRSMFEHYSFSRGTGLDGSQSVSPVKLYLAVLPGFETMAEDDPLYGESMLGIDIGPGGRLIHVNNRWNHAHDSMDQRKGDNKYSERELSELMGAPFFTLCPPMSRRDVRTVVSRIRRGIASRNREVRAAARGMAAAISSAMGRPRGIPAVPMCNVVEEGPYTPGTLARIRAAVERTRRAERREGLKHRAPDEDWSVPYDGDAAYVDLAAVECAGTRRLFLGSSVARVTCSDADAEYESSCMAYAAWRSSLITDGEPLPEDSEAEIASPMGFSRSGIPSAVSSGESADIVAGTYAGRHFAAYRPAAAMRSLPEGTRLPTVAEFVGRLLSAGATAEFDGRPTVKYGDDRDGKPVSVPGEGGRAAVRRALASALVFSGKGMTPSYGIDIDPLTDAEADAEAGEDYRSSLPARECISLPSIVAGPAGMGLEVPKDPRGCPYGILLSLGAPGNLFRRDSWVFLDGPATGDAGDTPATGDAGDTLAVARVDGDRVRLEVLGKPGGNRQYLVFPVAE